MNESYTFRNRRGGYDSRLNGNLEQSQKQHTLPKASHHAGHNGGLVVSNDRHNSETGGTAAAGWTHSVDR